MENMFWSMFVKIERLLLSFEVVVKTSGLC